MRELMHDTFGLLPGILFGLGGVLLVVAILGQAVPGIREFARRAKRPGASDAVSDDDLARVMKAADPAQEDRP